MIYNPYAFGSLGAVNQQQALPANNAQLMAQLQNPNQIAALQQQFNSQLPALSAPTATYMINPNAMPRRDAVAMAVPRPTVPLSEKLMRVGGAITGASEKGGLAAIQAGTQEYGSIMDQQRELELVYNKGLSDRIAASAAAQQEMIAENQDAINQYQNVLFDLRKARGYLTNPDGTKREGITGLFDGTIMAAIDNQTGDPDAAGRLLLEKLKVDDALLRIAQTKGAISNKEMDLFLKPAPSIRDDEQKWLDWIKGKEEAAMIVLHRLQNGLTVDPRNRPTASSFAQFSQTFGSPAATVGSAPAAGQSSTYISNGRQVIVKNVTPTNP
jgi:hypothetical protein